eukprot:9449849-Pyramimonas_sp.AAC.1
MEGREHMKAILKDAPNAFLVSLGDLGESKDCTQTQQLVRERTRNAKTQVGLDSRSPSSCVPRGSRRD